MSSLLFNRRLSSFLFLMAVSIMLIMIGGYLGNYYNQMKSKYISYNHAIKNINSWVAVANNVKVSEFNQLYSETNHSSLHIVADTAKKDNSDLLNKSNLFELKNAYKGKHKFSLSIRVSDDYYLNISWHQGELKKLYLGPALVVLIIIIFTYILYVLLLLYVSPNLKTLNKAVKRISYDIKAPFLEVSGSIEMKELLTSVNNMQSNLRLLLDNRTYMLAAISHDLKTPITRLKLKVEEVGDINERERLIKDLDDMDYMITSILAYSREQDADESLQKFDLAILIDSICCDYIDANKRVSFSTEIKSMIYFGRMLSIKRAISNIINNAILYGDSCKIFFRSYEKYVEISIQDNGPGIPDALLSKVCKPFYRVDSARSPAIVGSGLGLTICHDVIKAHGGTLEIKNKESGLLVLIKLPVSAD